jgi:hypothetical protein
MHDRFPPPRPLAFRRCETQTMTDDLRLRAPAASRNRDLILNVLQSHLPENGLILEVASGSGEHSVWFGERLPDHAIQPSDPDPRARASIDAWAAASGIRNIRPAIDLDAAAAVWTITEAAALVCINMIHISPWAATRGLLSGAARILPAGGPLFLYGPFKRSGAHTSQSNADFDLDLRRRNVEWGVRDLESVAELAAASGFAAPQVVEMPANNLSLIFRKGRAA